MKVETLFPGQFGATIFPSSSVTQLDQIDLSAISKYFNENKVLLFRDFNATKDDFINFSETIGKDFLTYEAGAYERKTIDGNDKLLSVTGFSQKNRVPLHGEMYYKKSKPKLLWFYCNIAPRKGGMTTVCDANLFYEMLKKKTKLFFASTPITYIRNYKNDSWKKIFNVEDIEQLDIKVKKENLRIFIKNKNTIETHYTCNAIEQDKNGNCYFLNNIMPVALQQRLRRSDVAVKILNDKNFPLNILIELFLIANKITRPIVWKKGDIVLIDNHSLLHGRTRIKDMNRDIFVRMSQSNMM